MDHSRDRVALLHTIIETFKELVLELHEYGETGRLLSYRIGVNEEILVLVLIVVDDSCMYKYKDLCAVSLNQLKET